MWVEVLESAHEYGKEPYDKRKRPSILQRALEHVAGAKPYQSFLTKMTRDIYYLMYIFVCVSLQAIL